MNHLSDSVSIVDVAADPPRVVAHAARRRRAARHRLRRPRRRPRLHHHRAPRPAAHRSVDRRRARRGRSAAHHGRRRPRRRLGVRRRRNLGSALGGMPLTIVDALRRHAARARGQPRRQHRLRRGLPLRQPDHDASARARLRRLRRAPARARLAAASPVPGGAARPGHERRRAARARGRPDRQVRTRRPATGKTSSAATGATRCASACPTTTSSRSTPTHARRRRAVCAGVGTTLFNMVVNPVNGDVYVSNTEAAQRGPLRGPGQSSAARTVQGHLARVAHHGARPARSVDAAPPEQAHRLQRRCRRPPGAEGPQPRDAASTWSCRRDGATLYVAAFGSAKVGVFDTADARERHASTRRRERELHRASAAAARAASCSTRRATGSTC